MVVIGLVVVLGILLYLRMSMLLQRVVRERLQREPERSGPWPRRRNVRGLG